MSPGAGAVKRQYSLAHLTALSCAPPEFTYLAARAGYDFVSLRLIPLGLPGEPSYLPEDHVMLRRTKAALAETGVKLLDLELARIIENLDPKVYLPAMEAAAELGARHVITSAWTQDPDDRNYLVDTFQALCELAQPLSLSVDLEFPTFSRIKSLGAATDVVRGAGCANGGILLDMLYVYYARVSSEELAVLPRQWLRFCHLCDAPPGIPATAEEQMRIARSERLYAGEGVIDVAGILSQLPDMPLSIELPNARRTQELGYEEHARRALSAARAYLDERLPQAPARISSPFSG